jgi:hypothetical protein
MRRPSRSIPASRHNAKISAHGVRGSGRSAPLAVVYCTPETVTPDPRNARTHSKQQIQQIQTSIQSFGFTNPILIDEAGAIIAGHGRLRAAKNLALAAVPTITPAFHRSLDAPTPSGPHAREPLASSDLPFRFLS